ncbi:MAG: LuxR C-terminal-related transcriptional regulator [Candidatus Methylomirabilia bacterium]
MADLLIASSDSVWRRRLAQSLRRGREVGRIREAEDRAGVENALAKLTPRVLLLDLPMEGFSGLDSLQTIRTLSPTTRTILLVSSPDDVEAVRCLKEGAAGYCSRKTESALLLKAVSLVRKGEIWVGRKVIRYLTQELAALHGKPAGKAQERLRLLTQRERQIARLIGTGASNKEIADRLSITERTVKAHLTNIFQRLGISSRLHLAIFAFEVELSD